METAILAVLLFCIMIFPHELGHFIVAKLCKVQVNQFALGMGPALLKKQKGETLYALRLIPIGGYCAMEGENEESDNPRAFNNKKWWQKLLVLFAGAGMNVLVCIVIMTVIAAVSGIATTTVGSIQDGAPASKSELKVGDKIVAINGKEVSEWDDVSKILADTKKDKDGNVSASTFTVIRDDEKVNTKITPEYSAKDKRMMVGIQCELEHNVIKAAGEGVKSSIKMVENVYTAFKMLVTGEAGVRDLTGPVGIISVVSQTADYGISSFFYLVAFISMNLAIVNLLPLPALDGGRILFVIIRGITGKTISDDMEGKIHAAGLVLLLALMVYVTWNDIVRLFT